MASTHRDRCALEDQGKTLPPLYGTIHLHVTFDGKNAVKNRFWSHPFHWKLFSLLCTVDVLIDLTHQPKV